MFSGIVEAIGIVTICNKTDEGLSFAVKSQLVFTDLKLGDSVAVNGVCLTVTAINNDELSFTAVPQTLQCSNLLSLGLGSWVNLERSMLNDGRNSGHYVQGHIDGVAEIVEMKDDGLATLCTVNLPQNLSRYVVLKGYIAIDGMSITVANITANNDIVISIIPYTKSHTIAAKYSVGSKVNIEVDILSKYIEKLITRSMHNVIS